MRSGPSGDGQDVADQQDEGVNWDLKLGTNLKFHHKSQSIHLEHDDT